MGWIFKSKANESYCLHNSGPVVQHYALMYGFHTLPNMLKNLLERGRWLCYVLVASSRLVSMPIPREVKG